VTGYDEIEALKARVVEQEAKIAQARLTARDAKQSYESSLDALQSSQRALNDLLHRKPTWTSTDVSQFTTLVQTDHSLSLSLAQSKSQLHSAEAQVDAEFSTLMRLILGRYHEEQVWSDKIRSAAT
jgi:sensitive to high expression protein 9